MNKYTIEQVIPHREPMVLIDSIEQYDVETCACTTRITENSLFYNHTEIGVPSYIGSEYMAQAIAAFAGAQALDNEQPIKIGFLLGSRKYKTFQPYFSLNDILTISIKELYKEESGLSVFECEILNQNNNVLAQANINVFQPEEPQAFLNNITQ